MTKVLGHLSNKLKGINVISKDREVILERRYLVNRPSFGMYLHKCTHPDLDPNLFHDHPWSWSFSIILWGYYIETRPRFGEEDHNKKRRFLSVNILRRNTFHRISEISIGGAWTLYFRGRRAKKDGFLLRQENGNWKHILAEDAEYEFKVLK